MKLIVWLVCDDVTDEDLPQGAACAGTVVLDGNPMPEDNPERAAQVATQIADSLAELGRRCPVIVTDKDEELFLD